MPDSPLLWIAFLAFIAGMLALDLGLFHKHAHVPSFREALGWTAVWAALAGLFGGWLGLRHGSTPCIEFFTGSPNRTAIASGGSSAHSTRRHPLLLAPVMVEISDVVLAIDSIPAIFAVTREPFLVLTANVFAILGLRSLFFGLAGMLDRFHYLKYGLAVVLTLVGLKLVLLDVVHLPPLLSLGVVLGVLGAAVVASWWRARHS